MKKIAILFATLMIAAMLSVPFASAIPLKEKSNDKFQTFSATSNFNMLAQLFANPTTLRAEYNYVPSLENCEKLEISWSERFTACSITIDSQTYIMNTDFKYAGHATWVFFKPEFNDPLKTIYWPSSYREGMTFVDYTYDFSFYSGGLEGLLNMRAVLTNGNGVTINSVSGTGDFQNVQIKAEVADYDLVGNVATVYHTGYVLGWPE